MKSVITKIIAGTAMMALAACSGDKLQEQDSSLQSNGHAVGEVRGTAFINKQIQNRVFDKNQVSTFNFKIQTLAGSQLQTLAHLLGEYVESGTHHEFKGGEPNPFGMLLWHQVIDSFADGLGSYCLNNDDTRVVSFAKTGASFTLHQKFSDKLLATCAWGDNLELQQAAAKDLWNGFIGYGAKEERDAFVGFFAATDSAFAMASAEERVSAMITAMMLNPHFLLEK
jgi:hypothetical protein